MSNVADKLADDLLDEARLHLRISSSAYDEEIRTLVASAVEDMLRVGLRESYVLEEGPMVRNAVFCRVKEQFGYDNEEAVRFGNSYRQIVCDMLNSTANSAAGDGSDGE